ncbi:hypothetical protein FGG79_01915 [Bacillus sp. BHET2]|uniref:hypothetical protein n=1 Tax=Bacillus sp. BHET2 TaxID=2583818 RepID=UPI00110E9E4D|nr:hypothetical protein [Bacillus sp. BHET2]TMU86923.1 hypothetical protein FGG79_01915 [Bacillus sp. BHET2]
MKGLKAAMIAVVLIAILLSGCNRNAADMIEKGSLTINDEAKTISFSGVLTDGALEPNTPFQVRFFIQGKTMRDALGIDLIYVDEKLKSHKEGEKAKEHKVTKTVDIKKTELMNKLISEIKNRDKEAITIEVVNDNGRIDDKVLHNVTKE